MEVEVPIRITFDVSPVLAALVREVCGNRSNQQQEEIMASLAEVQEATFRTGAAARAAIVRVAEDVAALTQEIVDLRAAVQSGVNNAAELAALKTGLDAVVTHSEEITGELGAVDPVPGSPAPPPPPPPVEPPVEPVP